MPPLSGSVSLFVDEFEQPGRSAAGQRQDVQSRQVCYWAQSGGFPMSASKPLLEPNRTSRVYTA